MRLRYEGLEFWTDGTGAGPFRVDRILGWSGERKPEQRYFDAFTVDGPSATVDEHGNTSAASIPLALDTAVRDGRIARGDTVLLQGVGGGFTWGAVLLDL